MNEIVYIGLILSLSVVSILFYVIFNVLYKNQKFRKIIEKEIELTRMEKRIDETDALQRGLHLIRRGKDKH